MAEDPRRLFQSKDVEAACLYAKRVLNDPDAYPVLINADGSLIVSITSGNLTFSQVTTAVTVSNAVVNPVNVSLTSTKVTIDVATNTGAVTTNTIRVVDAFDMGKTFSSSSGTLTATQVTVLLAGSAKNKVYAFSLTTTSTTGTIATFTQGSGGTEVWRVLLQAPSGANAGANLAVSPPAYLFASASNGTLVLNLSVAVRVDFSVAYYNEV